MEGNLNIFSIERDIIYICELEEMVPRLKKYLQEKNITTVEDMEKLAATFTEAEEVKVGKGMVRNFNKVMELYKKGKLQKYLRRQRVDGFTGKYLPLTAMNPLFEGFAIVHILDNFGFSKSFVNRFKNFRTLKDIKYLEYNFFLSNFMDEKEEKLFAKLANGLQGDFLSFFAQFFANLRTKSSFNYFLKRAYAYTLHEISRESALTGNGITSERIRQIEVGFVEILSPFISVLFDQIARKKQHVAVSDLQNLFVNDDMFHCVVYTGTKLPKYLYLEFAEKFMLHPGVKLQDFKINFLNKLDQVIGDCCRYDEIAEEVDDILEEEKLQFLEKQDIFNFLLQYRYGIYDEYIIKGRHTYGYLTSLVVRDYFPQGVRLPQSHREYPEDFLKLRELVTKFYGEEIPVDNINFSKIVATWLVQRGRGYYIAKEHANPDYELLEKVAQYIDSHEGKQIMFNTLFVAFQKELQASGNIDSPSALHGVLRMVYPDSFGYNRNYVWSLKKVKQELLTDQILDYIETVGRPVTREELSRHFFGITNIMICLRATWGTDFISWGKSSYYSKKLVKCDAQERDLLISYINELHEQNYGYCSDTMLYLKLGSQAPEFLNKHLITSRQVLISFVGVVLPDDFEYVYHHIFAKGKFVDRTSYGIITSIIGKQEYVAYSTVIGLLKTFHWANGSVGYILNKFYDEYLQLDVDRFIQKNKVDFSDKVDTVDAVLKNQMQDGLLVIEDDFPFQLLPEVGYAWNPYFLLSFIDKFSKQYHVAGIKYCNKKYRRSFVVAKRNKAQNFDHILAEMLLKQGLETLSQGLLLRFLRKTGFDFGVVPIELRTSKYFIFKDGVYTISKEAMN